MQTSAQDLTAVTALGALALSTAFPAFEGLLAAPLAEPIAPAAIRRELEPVVREEDAEAKARLRRVAQRERQRIALLELLPPDMGGADLETTAAELSMLAELTIEAALAHAIAVMQERHGPVLKDDGEPGSLTVLGMGKLGGGELNAGSDVDLMCFYDTDDAAARSGDRELSAHQFWTRVVRLMTELLEEPTEHGFVWRVDHRLRPEGARGPLVNSLAAAERYYETFGRLWERSALIRAKPVAGDRELGERLLRALSPFVWARRVDPSVATAMYDLVRRAREELSAVPERDLKLGPGGIREAEFFVQTLQLIWGGREPRLRERSTIAALERLRDGGFVTEREARELTDGYLALRRAEHAVQWATGLQTHSLPESVGDRERLARVLGFADRAALEADLETHNQRIAALLSSLLPHELPLSRWRDALLALDSEDFDLFLERLADAGMPDVRGHDGQLARDLFELGRQPPDAALGRRSRERHRHLAETILDAIADAADPTQAARFFRGFAARVRPAAVYTKLLADDPTAVRRLLTVMGGSAFVGEAVALRPELGDLVLFSSGLVDTEQARREPLDALAAPRSAGEDPIEQVVGHIRRAKSRITTQVALADLAGDLDTRQVTLLLSELADGTLEAATRVALAWKNIDALATTDPIDGLAVIAMGKLGGREIGYGSDLDVIFVYDPASADDPVRRYTRAAQRIISVISMPHHEGRGYELDTRLRPSGSQGLLVVSIEAFARYHGVALETGLSTGPRAETWERLALIRARFAAGDERLGRVVMQVVERAAYRNDGTFAEHAQQIARLRQRMYDELSKEGGERYDLKLGRGGLIEIELTVQLLQLAHPAVRTTDTGAAIDALAGVGALSPRQAEALQRGYQLLRRLEQRLRIVHGDSAHLLEGRAAGLVTLARRMGLRDQPGTPAGAMLLDEYHAVTEEVRRVYEEIVAVHD